MKKKNKEEKVASEVEQLNQPLSDIQLSTDLKINRQTMETLFAGDQTVIYRALKTKGDFSRDVLLVYCDGLTDSMIINDSIIRPLVAENDGHIEDIHTVMTDVLQANDVKLSSDLQEIVQAVTFGDTLLLLDGAKEGLIINSKGFETRSIGEPAAERILSGPREGFNESVMTNLSMIHRKLRTNQLKIKFVPLGRQSGTQVAVCYLDNIANPEIVAQVFQHLEHIEIDAVLDSNYIAELMQDSSRSPFRTTGTTERPDVVVGKLLEGRVAIIVDGSPAVLTLPYLFVENFQSSEDYYLNYYYASFSRILRVIGFFLTITLPGLYIALICYRQEIIPGQLFISIASERQSVPLPAPLEMIMMLIVFDILRETGIRMPESVGQALSIVGALVIGQTAVEAKLVASSMLIVVAFTGVTSLLTPKMKASTIFVRMLILFLSSFLGLFGFSMACSITLIHILSLRSMGISQIKPNEMLSMQKSKDQAIRAPWGHMQTRSPYLTRNKTRLKAKGRP